MISKRAHLFIILILFGIPILFQISGSAILRDTVSAIARRPGPNLYLERNDVLKPIPKYSLVKLRDGREGLYLWVYSDEVHIELDDEGGRAIVSPDQIREVVLHDLNVPVAAIGVGLVTGAAVLGVTRTSEIKRLDEEFMTYTETRISDSGEAYEVEVREPLGGGVGVSHVITYYPENALVFGAIGVIGGGYFARFLKKHSTHTIGASDWQLSIVDNLPN